MERTAFDRLLTAKLPQIEGMAHGFAHKYHRSQEWRDICQSALLKMLRFADQYDPEQGDLLPWACVVIINTIKTRVAQLNAHPRTDELDCSSVAMCHGNPEDDLQLSFMLDALGREAQLYTEGYNYAEIAARCGVKSKSTVKSRIDKGVDRLCGILGVSPVVGRRKRMVSMAPD